MSAGSAFAAARLRVGIVAVLFAAAAVAWWRTVMQTRGMDMGPWSALGTAGSFLGIWVVMMAAMMFPSVAPTVALYARIARARSLLAPCAFVAGYLITWASIGVLALAVARAGREVAGGAVGWDGADRWTGAATLLAAAVYELTPLKNVCLAKCRSPLGFILGSWRGGRLGPLRMGVAHGGWCVGCCWALMAALFALGVMSILWMAVVAALIAAEKTLPSCRLATWGTAAVLATLAVFVLAAPSLLS